MDELGFDYNHGFSGLLPGRRQDDLNFYCNGSDLSQPLCCCRFDDKIGIPAMLKSTLDAFGQECGLTQKRAHNSIGI